MNKEELVFTEFWSDFVKKSKVPPAINLAKRNFSYAKRPHWGLFLHRFVLHVDISHEC